VNAVVDIALFITVLLVLWLLLEHIALSREIAEVRAMAATEHGFGPWPSQTLRPGDVVSVGDAETEELRSPMPTVSM